MPAPKDDPVGIPDETRLFRRIDPSWITPDKNRGEWRPTSQNFQDSKDGTPMSVFAENVANANGELPSAFVREGGLWAGWYLAAITAGWMRELGQAVYLDPANQDPNDIYQSHAAVEGPKDNKTRSKISSKYEWVIPPLNRYDLPD